MLLMCPLDILEYLLELGIPHLLGIKPEFVDQDLFVGDIILEHHKLPLTQPRQSWHLPVSRSFYARD